MGLTQGPGRPENEAPAATPPERPAGRAALHRLVSGSQRGLVFSELIKPRRLI